MSNRLGGLPAVASSSTDGGSDVNAIPAGAPVVQGPSGVPPTGLKAFEIVDGDPTLEGSLLARPAGSVVILRDGSRYWLSRGGEAGWVSDAEIHDAAELAHIRSAIEHLVNETGGIDAVLAILHSGAQATAQVKVSNANRFTDGDWLRAPVGNGVAFIKIGFQVTDGYVRPSGVDFDCDLRAWVGLTDSYEQVQAALAAVLADHTNLVLGDAGGGFQRVLWPSVGGAPNGLEITWLGQTTGEAPLFDWGGEPVFTGGRDDTNAELVELLAAPRIRVIYDEDFNFFPSAGSIVLAGLNPQRSYEFQLRLSSASGPCTVDLLPTDSASSTSQQVTEFHTSALTGAAPLTTFRVDGAGFVLAARNPIGDSVSRGWLQGSPDAVSCNHFFASMSYAAVPNTGQPDVVLPLSAVGDSFSRFTQIVVVFSAPAVGHLRVRECP